MTLYTFYTNIGGLPEYTKNTRSCTLSYTGHDRRLYTRYRSRPTTLYTSYTIMWGFSEYTKNTRSCTLSYTGHDRRLYTRYRSRPTTLYTFYTIMWGFSEYTKNTRSCILTHTDHDRWLYKRLTQLLGLRSAGVGILIRRPRPCFSHRPDYSSVFTYGLGPTYYNSSINIRTIYGYTTFALRARYDICVLSWLCVYTESYMKYTL